MIASSFARLSTGIKMLAILSAALLPLGLVAFFASIESAKSNRLTREAEVRLVATDAATRLSGAVATSTAILRMVVNARPADRPACAQLLADVRATRPLILHLGLFDGNGRQLCATAGLSPGLKPSPPAGGVGTEVRAVDGPELLRFVVALPTGMIAVGEMPRATIAGLIATPHSTAIYGVRLREGDAIIQLSDPGPGAGRLGAVQVSEPVAGGQLSLELISPGTAIRAIEVVMILLPILMWLAAALIGWLVVDRLVLRPLGQLQKAVTAYGASGGSGPLVLPALTTPSAEIRALGEAFAAVTRALTEHEAELESGLARQTKLTREVHHRVKNNLQVVSSLINLHARGVTNLEAAAAYASIQRRVDALAVVHRNHFAELEENRGVGLRPLLGELASNLRATASPEAANMAITLESLPAFASQDVAVPVAFMVTELVELAMNCDPSGGVSIRLQATDRADRAELWVVAPGLTSDACRNHPSLERSARVLEGLSRQLRSPLIRDPLAGRYVIAIPVVPPLEPDAS